MELQTLKWAGHLARMNEDHCCKKIFLAKPMENRPRGRPPLRWIDCVEKDLNVLQDVFVTAMALPLTKHFVAVARIIQERYLLERDLRGKVPLNDSCLLNSWPDPNPRFFKVGFLNLWLKKSKPDVGWGTWRGMALKTDFRK
ncbi:hypothetical protein TNCV_1512821 [Trichonephila clavipes]|nr:hypothetical protein TNCV_1512821 [Trichonephila clavipes]